MCVEIVEKGWGVNPRSKEVASLTNRSGWGSPFGSEEGLKGEQGIRGLGVDLQDS